MTNNDFAPAKPDWPVEQPAGQVNEDEVLTYVREELADAEALDTFIAEDRAKALAYYLRLPMGDEREGRSSVVTEDVYQVVEGVSTAIANIFVQAKDPISFSPRSSDDTEKARQRTDTVKYVFFQQCNGFLSMLESIKDGIQAKTGYLAWRWEKDRRLTAERYRGISPIGIQQIVSDNPSCRIVEAKPVGQDQAGMPLFDVLVHVINEKGGPVVECVPPEEVLVTTGTRSADLRKSPTIIRRVRKTRDELLRCGYPQDAIDRISFGSAPFGSALVQREIDKAISGRDEALIYTGWFEHDFDGDGVVELRRITWSDQTVLENEITDERQISAWTPIVQPHEFFGRCPADEATQSQEISTVVTRQTLDNLYIANNPWWRVDTTRANAVNVDDFYSPEIGRVMQAAKDAAEPIVMPFVAQHSMPVLEYLKANTENTTGFTRYSQGMDAKSLNQTARGISIISNASQQRVKLMAQLYGELCLKPALKGIAKMLSQYGEESLSFRIDGSFVQIDPREWAEEYDMTCDVGLGVVDADQQLQQLMMIAQGQQAAVQGGALGKMLTIDNLYNVQVKIAETAGFKDRSFAWTNPREMPPPPPIPPPPEILKIQAQQQADAAKLKFEEQKAMLEAQTEERIAAMKLESEERIATYKAGLDHQSKLGMAEIGARAQPQVNVDAGGAMSERADALQATLAQQAEAIQQTLQVAAQAQQAFAQSQQAVLTALNRLTLPKRVVRDQAGRAVGVETIEPEAG